MKIIREDYWDKPAGDWICSEDSKMHVFDTISIHKGRFRVMKCTDCGLIDPCGLPIEYLEGQL